MNTTVDVPAEISATGAFKIRTRSPRRFLVINTRGRWVEKRTDNEATARAARRKLEAAVIFDTRTGTFEPATAYTAARHTFEVDGDVFESSRDALRAAGGDGSRVKVIRP